jgi:hypothetical protein
MKTFFNAAELYAYVQNLELRGYDYKVEAIDAGNMGFVWEVTPIKKGACKC